MEMMEYCRSTSWRWWWCW